MISVAFPRFLVWSDTLQLTSQNVNIESQIAPDAVPSVYEFVNGLCSWYPAW